MSALTTGRVPSHWCDTGCMVTMPVASCQPAMQRYHKGTDHQCHFFFPLTIKPGALIAMHWASLRDWTWPDSVTTNQPQQLRCTPLSTESQCAAQLPQINSLTTSVRSTMRINVHHLNGRKAKTKTINTPNAQLGTRCRFGRKKGCACQVPLGWEHCTANISDAVVSPVTMVCWQHVMQENPTTWQTIPHSRLAQLFKRRTQQGGGVCHHPPMQLQTNPQTGAQCKSYT